MWLHYLHSQQVGRRSPKDGKRLSLAHQDGRAVEPKSVLRKTHGWLTLQHGLFSQASSDSSHPALGMLGIQAEGLRIKVKARCPASRLKVHPTVALVWEQAGNRLWKQSSVDVNER